MLRELKNFFQWNKQEFSEEQLIQQNDSAMKLVGIACMIIVMMVVLIIYKGYLKIRIAIFVVAIVVGILGYFYMAIILNELELRKK